MHVLLLSDYETQGGAAQAASRLAQGLCRNHRVTRLVLNPDGQDHPWETISFFDPDKPPLRAPIPSRGGVALMQKLGRRLLPRFFPRPGTADFAGRVLRHWLRALRPDVVNLHNLHGGAPLGWGPSFLKICGQYAPVFWTLHDMWSFTGRCAYAYGCRRFLDGCDGHCPTPEEHPRLALDQIAPAWQQRRAFLKNFPKTAAITPSRWLANEARAGLWANHRVMVIPNGLNTEVYHPLSRAKARAILGLPQEGLLVLVAAQDLSERRKGGELLRSMWPLLDHRDFSLLTMGGGSINPGPAVQNIIPLGWIGQEQKKALVYNAADLLLHPAPVDNLPNCVVEAIACGTPVAALPIGGLPEVVRPGISGWLAKDASPASLACVLEEAVGAARDEAKAGEMRASCRRLALGEYTLERQADAYEDLFQMA